MITAGEILTPLPKGGDRQLEMPVERDLLQRMQMEQLHIVKVLVIRQMVDEKH